MKVWIVEEHDYESSDILGVFSTEEKADSTLSEVYEYDLDPLDDVPDNCKSWRVDMDREYGIHAYVCSNPQKLEPTFYKHWRKEYVMNVVVYAETQDKAMDIAESIKQEYLKTNAWKHD